jgi:hypothetical protein
MFAVRGEDDRRLGHIRGIPLARGQLCRFFGSSPWYQVGHHEPHRPVDRPDLPALEASAFVGKLQSGSKNGEKIAFSWKWMPRHLKKGKMGEIVIAKVIFGHIAWPLRANPANLFP